MARPREGAGKGGECRKGESLGLWNDMSGLGRFGFSAQVPINQKPRDKMLHWKIQWLCQATFPQNVRGHSFQTWAHNLSKAWNRGAFAKNLLEPEHCKAATSQAWLFGFNAPKMSCSLALVHLSQAWPL